MAEVLRRGWAGDPWLRAALFFCEEKPLLYDDDVPECALPAIARQSTSASTEWKDFMMSFHKKVE
jgi:hypothetical protein